MDKELEDKLSRLRALQGSPADLISRKNMVSKFIAELDDTYRVFCRGEVRLEAGWYPAALVYDEGREHALAWAPTGIGGAMCGHSERVFWSNIPHASICREVLFDGSGGTI